MKFFAIGLLSAAFISLAAPRCCFAQDKYPTLPTPPAKITVDGDLKDWGGDSLQYYDKDTKINYAIANSKDTLYMAVRVKDRSQETRILKAGLTFSIDPKGKKKEAFSITFPLNVQGTAAVSNLHANDVPDSITRKDRDELMRERLTTLRGIKVSGFKDIEDDMITTSNTYGIQTAVDFDDHGHLVCEAAIPMSFFHADEAAKNEWAFNFKINGMQQKLQTQSSDNPDESGSSRGGRGGRGGGGGRHGGSKSDASAESFHRDALLKSQDFWEKFYLAKQ